MKKRMKKEFSISDSPPNNGDMMFDNHYRLVRNPGNKNRRKNKYISGAGENERINILLLTLILIEKLVLN